MGRRIEVTPQTKYEDLPVWLTLKEACTYIGYSYNSATTVRHKKISSLPFSVVEFGTLIRVHKEQFRKPELELKF